MADSKRVWMLALGVLLSACGSGGGGGDGTPPPSPPVIPEPPPPPPPPPSVDEGPWMLDLEQGKALFIEKCQGCHGENGQGGYGPALTNTGTCPPCESFDRLWRRIDEFMPLRNPQACDADCSRHIASWILNGFSTVPSCTLDFRYDSIGADRYSAVFRIDNQRGLPVQHWRLGFRLAEGQVITAAHGAAFTRDGSEVLIEPDGSAATIADGGFVEFGIDCTHNGSTATPLDLRLEASPCFTRPMPAIAAE